MDLSKWMEEQRTAILDDAVSALGRAHLEHYESAGTATVTSRLARLFDLATSCLEKRNLTPVILYGAQMARERFEAGFDIAEVQTAINALEEATWKRIIAELPASEYAVALGSLGTVLGAAKDSLARSYVASATKAKSPAIDLTTVFGGL